MRLPVAVVLVCLAVASGSARTDSAPPTAFDYYPAVYEELNIEVQLAVNGSIEEVRRARVRMQSDAGADSFAGITVPIRSKNAEVRVVSAGIRESGGAERQLDAAHLDPISAGDPQFRVYRVPGVHPGDQIVFEADVRYGPAADTKWWLDLSPVFDLPVVSGNWTVRLPRGADLSSDVWHDDGHSEIQPGVHVWALAKVMAEERDRPWFGVSTFATWTEVGDWLRSRATIEPSPAVRAEAHRLSSGRPTANVIETLYGRVAQGVRSVDQPLVTSAYRARTPLETLTDGQGDDLSKNILLASLLASEGIECDLVFVSASATLDIDFPSPGQLAHVVGAAWDGTTWTWLDAGLEVGRAGALLPELRGRHGLLVSGGGSRIVQIPPALSGLNSVRAEWSGRLDANGDLRAQVRVEVRGDPEIALRRALLKDGGDLSRLLGKLLRPPFDTAAPEEFTHSDASDLSRPLVIQIETFVTQFVQPLTRRAAANLHALNLGDGCDCIFWAGAEQDPPLLPVPITAEEIVELTVPKEFRPIIPSPVSVKSPAGSLRSSTKFEGGVLRVRRSLEAQTSARDPANHFAASVMFEFQRSHVFEHTGRIDVEAILKDHSDSRLDSEGYEALSDDSELARVILEYATRRNPSSQYAWNNLGRAYEALGRPEDALKAYDKQIEVNPKDEWAYNNRGQVLSHLRRDQEAIGWFERQLEIVPEDENTLRNIGRSYARLEQWEKAEAYLRRALKLEPRNTEALIDLGQSLACTGDVKGGKEYFDTATRDCPPAASSVGLALAKCGVALDYALAKAQAATKVTGEAWDRTRDLPDWNEGASAQALMAADLATVGRILFRSHQPQPAVRMLEAAAALEVDEELLLYLRDAEIAAGNLRRAAQAHVEAQLLAGARHLEAPPAIAGRTAGAIPEIDASGWRKLRLGRTEGPAAGSGAWEAVLACTASEAGAVQSCSLLDGDSSREAVAIRDARRLRFRPVGWRGKPERVTRLIRLVYQPTGLVEASEAASPQAVAAVLRLMPRKKANQTESGDRG